jgi:hypothetical protein
MSECSDKLIRKYDLVQLLFSGKIACANVLSDLYAMGVTECDNMLMLLGVSTKMTEKERDIVVPLMMRGFKVFNRFEISGNILLFDLITLKNREEC